ncbi:hypothetical protein [Streptomyces sp. NPDC057412]|uniref:hypothetical protein n=1 Tax=Streptomyces sp. NPDC057412 TaxID=3346123 RepID=UPI003676405F
MTNPSHHANGPTRFTSSMNPEDAANFERTLELGKEIAASLPDHDVLGRWMAHHIGDLITHAETASDAEADDVRRETATAVLALWNHRAALPISRPPLDTFEPVFTALERLSEPQAPWDFYRMFPRGSEPSEEDLVAAPLLRMALNLEEIVRRVVRTIVTVAAREASDREAKWLRLSDHVEDDEQRAARDAILELAQLLETYTGDADGQPATGDAGLSKLITDLLHAETQLAEARGALEDRLPERRSGSESGGPV